MSVLSKLLLFDYNLPFSCYELGHSWEPSCSMAALDLGSSTLREAFKLYLPLFLINQLIKKKYDLKAFKQTLSNVVRSSMFLSLNCYLGMLFFCWFRLFFGKFYYILSCWPPSFLASFLAIQLEQSSRRGPLALYTLNLASQTLINNLVSKKYLPSIPNFDVFVFTLSIATQFYLMKRNGYANDLFSSVTKFLLGESEIHSKSMIEKYKYRYDLYQPNNSINNSILGDLLMDKHRSCIHRDNCLIYVLKGFLKPFLISTLVQLASKTLLKPKLLLDRPSILVDEIKKSSNYRLGMFTGVFSSVFKLSSCLLRRKSDGRREWHTFVSALLAGPFIYLNPNSSISLYVLWKALESVYYEAVNSKMMKHRNIYPSLLYSLATAHIFYTAIVEPEYLKPSYMKFVNRTTDGRIDLFNRPLFRGFFNRLDDEYLIRKALEPTRDVLPEYTSRQYKELIETWCNV